MNQVIVGLKTDMETKDAKLIRKKKKIGLIKSRVKSLEESVSALRKENLELRKF